MNKTNNPFNLKIPLTFYDKILTFQHFIFYFRNRSSCIWWIGGCGHTFYKALSWPITPGRQITGCGYISIRWWRPSIPQRYVPALKNSDLIQPKKKKNSLKKNSNLYCVKILIFCLKKSNLMTKQYLLKKNQIWSYK
jgi:hypothetical protein